MRRSLTSLVLLFLLCASAPSTAAVAASPAGVSPAALRPAPGDADDDRERLFANGCLAGESVVVPPNCVFAKRGSGFTLALVGDSHTSHLFPGFERLAKQRGWRLVTFLKVSCPLIDIAVRNIYLERRYHECETFNKKAIKRLRRIRPDITVIVPFRWIHPIDGRYDTPGQEGKAIGRMLAQVPGKRLVIVDTPYSFDDIPDCVMRHAPSDCAIPRSEVETGGVGVRERAAAKVGHATYASLNRRTICGGYPCRVVTNGILMFRDHHHLTATYAATLSGALGRVIDRALASG